MFRFAQHKLLDAAAVKTITEIAQRAA